MTSIDRNGIRPSALGFAVPDLAVCCVRVDYL